MTGFEYGLGIVAVVIGLALTDVAQSTHRLLVRRRAVRWDPLTALVALYVLLTVVRMWFAVWSIRDVGEVLYYPFYVSLFAELFVLYLLAAACLPDECTPEGVDLRAFYDERRAYIWSLFTVFQASYLAHWFYFAADEAGRPADLLRGMIWPLAPLLIYAALIFIRRRSVHYAALAVLVSLHVGRLWTVSL